VWLANKRRYHCFAHMRRRYECMECSRDLCPRHLATCTRCNFCSTNRYGQLVPCAGRHLKLVQECPKCTNDRAFTSLDAWQLCDRHNHFRAKEPRHRRNLYQLAVLHCRRCTNVLETKGTARKRHDHFMQDYNRTSGRGDDAVQQNDAKVGGQDDFQDDKANARYSGGDVDGLKL
jgi:hypothetical protein